MSGQTKNQTIDPSLIERIHSLPAELFNRIRGYTLHATTPSQEQIMVEYDEYLSPSELQNCRYSRDLFAENYYSNTVFIFPYNDKNYSFLVWLKHIPAAHREHLRKLCLLQEDSASKPDWSVYSWLWQAREDIIREFGETEACASAEVLHVNVMVREVNGRMLANLEEPEDDEGLYGGYYEVWMSLKDLWQA